MDRVQQPAAHGAWSCSSPGSCLLAALPRGRAGRGYALALVQPLGVVAQAVIGGMTVLTGLVWWRVAVHFLVSMVLVWLGVQLVDAASDGDGPPRAAGRRAVRRLVAVSTVVFAALLVAGTLVTAAGPHAGDAATPRLGIGVPAAAQLHADLLFGYLGLLVGLGFALAAVPRRPGCGAATGCWSPWCCPGRARRHPVRARRA